MNKRLQSLLLAALLFCLPLFVAMAAEPAVNDTAAVLSQRLMVEADQLDTLLHDHLGMGFVVLTKHFLGGADPQAYAQDMLDTHENHENLALLLMVVGEERYALALGEQVKSVLSSEKANSLLSNHFRKAFLVDRDYDQATAGMLLALSQQMQYAKGSSLPTNSYLLSFVGQKADAQPTPSLPAQPTRVPTGIGSWLDSIFVDPEESESYAQQYQQDAEMAYKGLPKGLSLFQIALIGYVLFRIFGRTRDGRRKGCGPLGWIFGTWGASKFFGWRK